MKRCFLSVLLLIPLFAGQLHPAGKNLSGMWHYGIHRSPEYLVRIRHEGGRISAEYLIRDPASGAEFVYARVRGVTRSYWDCYLEGEYIRSSGRTRKGTRFRSLWLVFDRGDKIQTLSYWGEYRITSHLVREGSPYGSEP